MDYHYGMSSANSDRQSDMNVKYNLAVNTVNAALKIYAHCLPRKVKHKFPEFVKGRVGLIRRIAAEMQNDDNSRPLIWFHASSLGEFAIARPLIARLREKGGVRIAVTFFSPSGYRVLRPDHPGIDHVFYLPLDTRKNVFGFLEVVKPAAAVFLVSEYWPNMLQELKFRSIPTFLVSALIRNDASFFRWYGKIFRKALNTYRHFYVLDENSRFNLNMLGYDNVSLSGDPLFDNAALTGRSEWTDPVMERFTDNKSQPVFMAGSVSDRRDIMLVAGALADHPGLKAVIVPHDISEPFIKTIRKSLPSRNIALYSQLTRQSDLSSIDTIIVDCVGKLAYLYRYATMAYVGGGFTPLLHSVIEATVYGIPVSFGPRIERKVTPKQLIEIGAGTMVDTPVKLSAWIDSLTTDKLREVSRVTAGYVKRNIGSTNDIAQTIYDSVWQKK